MAGTLSLTVEASVRKHSWKSRALSLGASAGLQTAVLLALGVAPLVTLGAMPEPRRSEPASILHIVEMPAPPPASAANQHPARPSVTSRPRAPSRIVAPSEFSGEILIEQALEDFDPDFSGRVYGGVPHAGVGAPDESRVAPPEPPPVPTGPVSIGGEITPPRKRLHVSPVYPPIALAARLQGTVVLEAIIDAGGNVVNLRVLHSIPLLDRAALEAVRQWKYEPTYLNGRPVPVVMSVNVDFQLTR